LFTDTITNAFFGEAVEVALDRFHFGANKNSALLGRCLKERIWN